MTKGQSGMPIQALIISSKDPYTFKEAQIALDMADQLADLGAQVTVYLIEDGVLAVRAGQMPKNGVSVEQRIKSLRNRGVNVLAEDLSLKARGITDDKAVEGVKVSNLDEFVDILMERSNKVIWF